MKLDLNEMMRLAVQSVTADVLSEKEREARDAKTIAERRAALPGVPLYKTHVDEQLLIFRPPTADAWERITAEHSADGAASKLILDLVGGCLVHPSPERLQELTEHRPALMAKLAEQCTKIAGLDNDLNFKRAR